MNKHDKRCEISVGYKMHQVSPAAYWYKYGHFKNEDEARGAFRLAYQQGMDGMGKSIAQWMGLTNKEYDLWMRNDAIPSRALHEVAMNSSNEIDRWVAYLDVLGVKNLIKTAYWTEIFDVYATAIKHFRRESFDGHLIRRLTFSDSFIIYTTDGGALSYRALDTFVRYFIASLIRHKIPIRGAMAFGKFYVDDANDLYFGKALVEAHELSELQDWVGFVLCNTVVVRLKELKLPANERLNYACYSVPLKKCHLEDKNTYAKLPAFIIGNGPSAKGQDACRKALLSMKNQQKDERIKRKYDNTLTFMEKNIRNPIN